MAPPTFGDLGKSARDVFSKGYHFGQVKLDVKTKSASGVEFTTSGSHALETGKQNASLETKYKCSEHGVTITESWNADNTLNTEFSMEDKIAKGLKLVLASKFAPKTGALSGTAKSTFKADAISLNVDTTLDTCPTINGAAVAGYQSWVVGGQVGYDTAKAKLTKSNLAIGFTAKDFTLHTYCNNGSVYGGSLHQKVKPDLDIAVDISYVGDANVTKFAAGAKYKLDCCSTLGAKVTNTGQVGLGFQHKLRDGVTVTLSSLIDGGATGNHNIGLGLDFAL